jgi:hypothetical protein
VCNAEFALRRVYIACSYLIKWQINDVDNNYVSEMRFKAKAL